MTEKEYGGIGCGDRAISPPFVARWRDEPSEDDVLDAADQIERLMRENARML